MTEQSRGLIFPRPNPPGPFLAQGARFEFAFDFAISLATVVSIRYGLP